ncbi:MAG TPA: histidine phosphotransferase family protein [Dongiaceae bacterium]|nr:histidine phosphotransferase family protein [Dongiaceae bacterium]
MDMKVDLNVVELLCSRICHDLISPIGAVGNGLELLEDEVPEAGAEALQLSIKSARRAAALLQCFRMAYGAAGNQPSFAPADARALAAAVMEGGRVRLDWPPGPADGVVPPGAAKLMLNLVLLGLDCLPRGGTIAVGFGPDGAGRPRATVTATGRNAGLGPALSAALTPQAAAGALDPKAIHAYFAARLAESLGGRIEAAAAGPDSVALAASVAAA